MNLLSYRRQDLGVFGDDQRIVGVSIGLQLFQQWKEGFMGTEGLTVQFGQDFETIARTGPSRQANQGSSGG